MWVTGVVIKKINWNDKLFSLQIKANIEPFIAGQFIKLSQMKNGKRLARAYSLVNSPTADYIEVLAISVENGQLSPRLQDLNEGDEIEVSTKAAGFMTLNEIAKDNNKHLWFLATGTAVGPFISMLETPEPWQRFEKIVLVYGVRYSQDLAYWDKLSALQTTYKDRFKLLFCVTRENCDHALNCRIPAAIGSGQIEKMAEIQITQKDSQVMVCGNPDMINETLQILQKKGLTKNLRREPGQITLEKYW